MSGDLRCGTCTWWLAGHPPRAAMERLPGTPEPFLGICVVNPPVVVVGAVISDACAMFPQTHENRACRLWQPDTSGDEPGGGERADLGEVVDLAERRAA